MGKELLLKGLVGNVESGSILRAESTGSISQPKALGELVANQLLDIGAGKLLEGV
jgi:porphobilinogen deaminase